MMIHKVFNKTSYVCYRFALAEDKIKYYDQKIQKSMLNAGLTNFFPLYIAKGKREETDLRKGRRWQCYSGPSIGDTGAQLTISVLFFFTSFLVVAILYVLYDGACEMSDPLTDSWQQF